MLVKKIALLNFWQRHASSTEERKAINAVSRKGKHLTASRILFNGILRTSYMPIEEYDSEQRNKSTHFLNFAVEVANQNRS